MNSDDIPPLVNLNKLLRSIDDMSITATNYLTPVVRFVGHRDNHFDSLYRRFPGLIHEKRFSGLPSHLVIFDDIPDKELGQENSLTADCAYLFCLDHDLPFSSSQKCILSTKLSATLRRPGIAEFNRIVDTMLMMQGISISDGRQTYPSLMSVDYDFRHAFSSIINASIEDQSCIAFVPTMALRNDIVNFLYSTISDLLQPFQADLNSLNISRLPIDRHTLIQCECASVGELEDALYTLEEASLQRPVICLITTTLKCDYVDATELNIVDFHDLRERSLDALLIAHWSALNRTFETNELRFFSHAQMQRCVESADYDSSLYVLALHEIMPTEIMPCTQFTDFLELYKRPTIDDIFDEAQRRVMRALQSRSNLADAASSAAGIPTVTFRKRVRRYQDKKTFLGLVSRTRDED